LQNKAKKILRKERSPAARKIFHRKFTEIARGCGEN
jgi:hypothetical protein